MLGGSFYYSKIGPAGSYDFEIAVRSSLLTVFAQMFERLRHDEPLQTMAYTLFGLLYVLWLLISPPRSFISRRVRAPA